MIRQSASGDSPAKRRWLLLLLLLLLVLVWGYCYREARQMRRIPDTLGSHRVDTARRRTAPAGATDVAGVLPRPSKPPEQLARKRKRVRSRIVADGTSVPAAAEVIAASLSYALAAPPANPPPRAIQTPVNLVPAAILSAVVPTPEPRVAVAEAPVEPPTEVTGSIATGVHVQSFSFAKGSDVDAAMLVLVPFAWQQRISRTMAFDMYSAYASGTVRAGTTNFSLRGPVDSWIRLRWEALPGVIMAAAVNLPTGLERHDAEQAVVASALSNDLLGFREGNWGAGASGTFGLSWAKLVGRSNITFGLSYRTDGTFQPSTDTTLRYAPGAETRARIGLDRTTLTSALSGGLTFQRFAADQVNHKNLFQSGNRYTADLSFAHRAWSLYADDVFRDHGELILPVTNILDGTYLRDTTLNVGWQNLAIVGANAVVPLGSSFILQPTAEFKWRSREQVLGNGWLAGAGATLPLVMGGLELFPTLHGTVGRMVPTGGGSGFRPLWGAEFSLVFRHTRRTPIRPYRSIGDDFDRPDDQK